MAVSVRHKSVVSLHRPYRITTLSLYRIYYEGSESETRQPSRGTHKLCDISSECEFPDFSFTQTIK